MADITDAELSPKKTHEATLSPKQIIEEHIRNNIHMFEGDKRELGFRWVENPVYDRSELNVAAKKLEWEPSPPSGDAIDAFSQAVFERIFEGRTPAETGYVRSISQPATIQLQIMRFKYEKQIHFYRLPLVEDPRRANDYLYFALAPGYKTTQVFTGLLKGEDELSQTALTSPVEPKSSLSGLFNSGFASNELLEEVTSALRKLDQKSLNPINPPQLPVGKG